MYVYHDDSCPIGNLTWSSDMHSVKKDARVIDIISMVRLNKLNPTHVHYVEH